MLTMPAQNRKSAAPAEEAQSSAAPPVATGMVNNFGVGGLLAAMQTDRVSGRLELQSTMRRCKLYLDNGNVYHAESQPEEGDWALFEALCWQDAHYSFYYERRHPANSIKNSIDAYIPEASKFIEQRMQLHKGGFSLDASLVANENAGVDFNTRNWMTRDVAYLRWFYESVVAHGTLVGMLRMNPMLKVQWSTPLLDLLQSGMISTSYKPRPVRPPLLRLGAQEPHLKYFLNSTGSCYSYAALLFALEQEFLRHETANVPFSLVVLKLRTLRGAGDETGEPLPEIAVKELLRRTLAVVEDIDQVFQFEKYDYALLLPNTAAAGAQPVAEAVYEGAVRTPLMPGIDVRNLGISIVVASVPDHCTEPPQLLPAIAAAHKVAMSSFCRILHV
jgi:GGDEF domain-containing protein